MRKTIFSLAAVAALACAPAHAAVDSYFATLFGSNEFPGPGDTDGFGLAYLSIDNVANSVSWSIQAFNIDLPLTGAHIHTGAAGTSGGVIVNFNAMLVGNGLSDPDLASIKPGTASGFYVNLHNGNFPNGAIRGQLQYLGTVQAPIPEPETYALMLAGLGLVGFMAKRRARQA